MLSAGGVCPEKEDGVPPGKLQFHVVGLASERSVKVTVPPVQTVVGVAENSEVSAGGAIWNTPTWFLRPPLKYSPIDQKVTSSLGSMVICA
jgi:hypothetical protein